jgi:hypothetical protein
VLVSLGSLLPAQGEMIPSNERISISALLVNNAAPAVAAFLPVFVIAVVAMAQRPLQG